MYCIHAVEYYTATKKNEVLTHATMWMSFEQITLSGRSQTNNSLHMKCPEQATQ